MDHKTVEQHWQRFWQEQKIGVVDVARAKKPLYNLVMFPYPSGYALHIGHWFNYGGCDTYGRYKRMKGYDVFQPMGFDSFGLPAENYAIKTGTPPAESTKTNIAKMRSQIQAMGGTFAWDHELTTSDPEYYRWTQWLFLQLYRQGLAHKRKAAVNWCPSCQTVLANEQVIDGKCERDGSDVIQKDLEQWFFATTTYAERLLANLDHLDWPETTKHLQRNWIGKKEGITITYPVVGMSEQTITVFTTRPETNFGATFVVIAPEHPQVEKITTPEYSDAVKAYCAEAHNKKEIERLNTTRKKTGVFTGNYAKNSLTGYHMPIYVADYVLMGFGTGVVVGVPGHDVRDWEFAQAFDLEIQRVVLDDSGYDGPIDTIDKVFEDEGTMVNSGFLNGLSPREAIPMMMDYLEEKGYGKRVTTYRLKDWLISRQRYWGAPIPIVYCDDCGIVPVPDDQLPVLLPPELDDYKPKGTAPLADVPDFVNTTCPTCGKPAKRETDTMDTFVCSSWYYLRYLEPQNATHPFPKDSEILKKWLPIAEYFGGIEHACMHLLYARFVNMALHDAGLIPNEEPFAKLRHQGIIIKDGTKMSKSKGNVVNPDTYVEQYGADVFRMYLLFMGPFEEGGDFNDRGIVGIKRFLDKVERLVEEVGSCKGHDHSDGCEHEHLPPPFEKRGIDMEKDANTNTMCQKKNKRCCEHQDKHPKTANYSSPSEKRDVDDDKLSLQSEGLGEMSDAEGMKSDAGQKATKQSCGLHGMRHVQDKQFSTLHRTIRDCDAAYADLRFNVAIAKLMELANWWGTMNTKFSHQQNKAIAKAFLRLLAPLAPHVSEELWHRLGREGSIHQERIPTYTESLTTEDTFELVIQVNGKARDKVPTERGKSKDELQTLALSRTKVKDILEKNSVRKIIVIPDKLVNIVI